MIQGVLSYRALFSMYDVGVGLVPLYEQDHVFTILIHNVVMWQTTDINDDKCITRQRERVTVMSSVGWGGGTI